MRKNKTVVFLALAAMVAAIAAMGLAAGPRPAAVAGDSGLTVPSANMSFAANFQAKPAGNAAAVAWSNIRVNSDRTSEAQNEPFVAINPNNSQHIVVGANSWETSNGHFEVFAYVSFNGGKTWASSRPYIDRHAGRMNAADPTIAFGADGAVYFAFIALTPADGAVAVSRSNDGGLSWVSQTWATAFTSQADKPAIAFSNGTLYTFYQNSSLHGTVSADGGSTWSAPSRIEFGGRNASPVVGQDGVVSVFYNTADSIKMARPSAARGGYSVSTVANAVPLQARPTHYRASVYAAAGAGANGNLYVAWADGRNVGSGNDILYTRSGDNGTTWSAPVALNTDGTSADQLMPALAVNSNGSVTAIWLDNRNDPANVNYDVYTATSVDGVNFSANQRVTSVSSNPYNDPRTQGRMIGDYFGLASSNGATYAVWADTRNNNADIYMAPLGVGRK